MKYNLLTLQTLRKSIGFIALPLATVGCQHSHVATTQVVVNVGSNQTAIAEVAAPDSSSPPATQAAPGMGSKMSEASQQSGHAVAQASRDSGHAVAEASRNTYHAAADDVRSVGSGAASLTTDSVVMLHNTPPESLSAPVIVVDPAMQERDWDQSTAVYSSGATVAGPIGFLYAPKGGQPAWHYGVIEVPLFMVNTVVMPFALFETPPWKPVEWKASTVEPSYTAVPPLPAE